MQMGSYCQEGRIDCLLMMISSVILIADSFRLVWQIVQTSRHSAIRCNSASPQLSTVKQLRGKERKFTFRMKISGILLILGISIAQIAIWILINHSSQSIIILQMFGINIFACILWICAVSQDKKYKGFTKPLTQVNMHINLLSNIFVALLGAKNSLDNSDDTGFYTYLGYIGASGLLQIFIKTCQKDFESISLDDLDSKDSSVFSIENQRKTTSNNERVESTKIDANVLTEKLLSDDEKSDNKQNSIGNNNSIGNEATNAVKRVKSKEDINKRKRKSQNLESIDCKDRKSGESDNTMTSGGIVSRCQDNCDEEEETKICKYRIENIRIERFLETIKYSKKTIVYEIKCTFKGKMYSVKRSFREFGALNTTIKQRYKDKKLPQFPQKKAQNSILTYNDLEERKKLLCIYLQNLNLMCEYEDLMDFLTQSDSQSTSPTSQSSYQQQQQLRNGQKKSFGEDSSQQSTFNSGSAHNYNIPEIIWEEEEELNVSASSHD